MTYKLFFRTDDPIVCTSSAQFSTKHFWWSEKKPFSQTKPYFENSFLVASISKIFETKLDQTFTAYIHKVIGRQIRRFNIHSPQYSTLDSRRVNFKKSLMPNLVLRLTQNYKLWVENSGTSNSSSECTSGPESCCSSDEIMFLLIHYGAWWLNYITSHSSKIKSWKLLSVRKYIRRSIRLKSKMVVNIEKLFELYEKHGSKDRFKSQMTLHFLSSVLFLKVSMDFETLTKDYIGEPVSQIEHMVQAAMAAEAEGRSKERLIRTP